MVQIIIDQVIDVDQYTGEKCGCGAAYRFEIITYCYAYYAGSGDVG